MPENFQQLLEQLNLGQSYGEWVMVLLSIVSLFGAGFLFYFVAKGYIMPLARKTLAHFKPELADSIEVPLIGMTDRLALLAPLTFYLSTYSWFVEPQLLMFAMINKAMFIYLYINVVLFLISALNIAGIVYNQQSYAKDVPINGIIQIIKLAIFIVFVVLTVSELISKTPLYLLSSLGALTAVLLLIFKDTILGLVAGIQIATHRLVAHGDWIEMPQYGADGEVLEVGLHTVKVCNWDKTITTIPTYKLISDSFKNWRGMSLSGGRRLKRAFHIDVNSVAFIDDETTNEMLNGFDYKAFVKRVKQEGPSETNLALFRRYCEFYLEMHELVNQEMTLIVRQLQPAEYGVVIELYCFCHDKRWVEYERFQSEVIEHVLARLPAFGLQAFQRPAGSDLRRVED